MEYKQYLNVWRWKKCGETLWFLGDEKIHQSQRRLAKTQHV